MTVTPGSVQDSLQWFSFALDLVRGSLPKQRTPHASTNKNRNHHLYLTFFDRRDAGAADFARLDRVEGLSSSARSPRRWASFRISHRTTDAAVTSTPSFASSARAGGYQGLEGSPLGTGEPQGQDGVTDNGAVFEGGTRHDASVIRELFSS
jgi:hypothetical protein